MREKRRARGSWRRLRDLLPNRRKEGIFLSRGGRCLLPQIADYYLREIGPPIYLKERGRAKISDSLIFISGGKTDGRRGGPEDGRKRGH